MKTLLWLSRHEPNKVQIQQIVNKIGAVEVIRTKYTAKEDMKQEILSVKPDCIVAILPVSWFSYLLKGIPKTTIFLKPKCKSVHPGECREEPCQDYNISDDILIDPSEKRWEGYITKGENKIHLRHSGYERIIATWDKLLFINWK